MNSDASVQTPAPTAPSPPPHLKRKLAWCGLAILFLTVVPKLGIALLYTLHNVPWAMMLINPLGPFQAASALHDPLWIYLLVGTFRLSLAHPAHYLLGKYGAIAIHQQRPPLTAHRFRVVRWWGWLIHHLGRPARALRRRLVASRFRLVRWFGRYTFKVFAERHFRRWGHAFIILRPNSWMMMLAGASGLRPRSVAIASTIGVLLELILIGFLAAYIPGWFFIVTSIF